MELRDLPARKLHLTLTAHGYIAPLVYAKIIQENGTDTDARPGRVVQGIGEFEWTIVMNFGGIPFDEVEANTCLVHQEILPELRTWGADRPQG